jgi:outer membrane immunogenic protein
MRKSSGLALASIVLAGFGFSGAASAADMAVKAPMYKAAPVLMTNWTGIFIGGEAGGGWARDSLFFPVPLTTTGRYDISGAVAGGVIGYNWQAPGSNWVFGVEGNFDWADIKGSTACPNVAFNCRTRLDEIFTGTGRIGYAWDKVMLYAKGGYAWTNDRVQVIVPATGAVNDSARTGRDGYTVGAGLEYMFAPSWSAKVEYDYYRFDGKTVNATNPGGVFVEPINMTGLSVNTVKGGINYHFNWNGPVVAKY